MGHRKGVHAEALLGDCRGFLHADGYAGFTSLYRPNSLGGNGQLIEVACWSHFRRKLYDVHHATASPIALEALERIAALFVVESSVNGCAPDRRRAARAEHAAPLLDDLKTFLDTSLTKISGKSDLAKAIRYALSQDRCPAPLVLDKVANTRSARSRQIRGRQRTLTIGAALSAQSVALIVKRHAETAGLDPHDFAGHSLRAGFLTSAAEAGADVLRMMEVSRHKRVETVQGYVRRANGFKGHAGKDFL